MDRWLLWRKRRQRSSAGMNCMVGRMLEAKISIAVGAHLSPRV
jgi:hypothetical protein